MSARRAGEGVKLSTRRRYATELPAEWRADFDGTRRNSRPVLRLLLVIIFVISLVAGLDYFTPMQTIVVNAATAAARQLVALGSSSKVRVAATTTVAPAIAPTTLSNSAAPTATVAPASGAITAALAPTITLSPTKGGSGMVVKIAGVNFSRGKAQITWDGDMRGMPTVQANANGEFKTSITVPTDAVAGAHAIAALDSTSGGSRTPTGQTLASTFFSVLLLATPLPIAATQSPVTTTPPPSSSTAAPTSAPTATPLPTSTAAPTTPTPVPTSALTPTPAPTLAPTPTPAPTSSVLPSVTVAAPNPPAAYSLPLGAVNVASSSELIAALNRTTATDIVLADGVYDGTAPFQNIYGHRIYAARLGGAVFHAGLVMGGNIGPGHGLVRGVVFDVSDASKTLLSSIIHVWGTGAGSQILDSTFDGHNVISSGIHIPNPDGVVVSRIQVHNLTSYGVFADASDVNRTLAVPVLLEDIDVSGVSRAIPKSSNGTAEACIWLGDTGTLRRARVRNCALMGVWTGTANHDSLHEDLDIDQTPVAIYMEHFTTRGTFQRILVGPTTSRAVNCEWADPGWGSKPGCVGDVIQDSTFMSADVGVQLNPGTTTTTVRRVKFIGQRIAAIDDAQGIGNTYYDNDYTQIASTAVPISYDIINYLF